MVPDLLPPVERDRSAVERILRNGDHDAITVVPQQCHQHRLSTLAGSVSQHDVVLRSGDAIAFGDEVRNGGTDQRNPCALRVGTGPVRMAQKNHPCALYDIVRIELQCFRVAEECRVFNKAEELPDERQRPLPEGLGIADIAIDNLLPLFLKLLSPDDDGPPHRILSVEDPRIEMSSNQHDWAAPVRTGE